MDDKLVFNENDSSEAGSDAAEIVIEKKQHEVNHIFDHKHIDMDNMVFDIDSLEEKPWRKPGADLTDYFNYGFDENSWKFYCLQQKEKRELVTGINTELSLRNYSDNHQRLPRGTRDREYRNRGETFYNGEHRYGDRRGSNEEYDRRESGRHSRNTRRSDHSRWSKNDSNYNNEGNQRR